MKTIKLYFFAIIASVLTSCSTDMLMEPSDFDIKIDTTRTYKVGDTLRFIISGGKVDQITFFSGELGRNYSNINRIISEGIPKLVFQSSLGQGSAVTDSLRLMISSNLKGYDSINVVQANWTDITARNSKWSSVVSTKFTTSDSIDLSDFNNVSDSINLAFRFIGHEPILPALQAKWQISNLTLTNILPDGNLFPLFSTFDNTGWVQVSLKNQANTWDVGNWNMSAKNGKTNSSGITIRTVYPITLNTGTAANDDWLITSAINLKSVKPDAGVTIKNSANLTMTDYEYIYKMPGVYTLTFVAANLNLNESKKLVKQIKIEILP
jgi:hypothetical protein